jgi:hypothetical protein
MPGHDYCFAGAWLVAGVRWQLVPAAVGIQMHQCLESAVAERCNERHRAIRGRNGARGMGNGQLHGLLDGDRRERHVPERYDMGHRVLLETASRAVASRGRFRVCALPSLRAFPPCRAQNSIRLARQKSGRQLTTESLIDGPVSPGQLRELFSSFAYMNRILWPRPQFRTEPQYDKCVLTITCNRPAVFVPRGFDLRTRTAGTLASIQDIVETLGRTINSLNLQPNWTLLFNADGTFDRHSTL